MATSAPHSPFRPIPPATPGDQAFAVTMEAYRETLEAHALEYETLRWIESMRPPVPVPPFEGQGAQARDAQEIIQDVDIISRVLEARKKLSYLQGELKEVENVLAAIEDLAIEELEEETERLDEDTADDEPKPKGAAPKRRPSS